MTTAENLESPLRDQITATLQERTGKPVVIHWKVDHQLIGGIVVRIGDQVLDASVARKLITIRQEAVDKAVQQMRAASDRFTAS